MILRNQDLPQRPLSPIGQVRELAIGSKKVSTASAVREAFNRANQDKLLMSVGQIILRLQLP